MRNYGIVRLVLTALLLLCGAITLTSSCEGGGPGLPPPPDTTRPGANVWSPAGESGSVRIYDHGEGLKPDGLVLVDSFELLKTTPGPFSEAVEIRLKLTNPLTPDTRVYIYFVDPKTGAVVPVTSAKVGEDGTTITFTLTEPGKYLILLLAADLEAATRYKAWAFADRASGDVPCDVNFFAFNDGGIEPVEYAWDFGDGGAGEGETTSHRYIAVGQYTITLTATDAGGRVAVFTSTDVLIGGQPSPLSVQNQQPQATGNPREYRFVATVAGGVAPHAFVWNFGDGTTSAEQNPTHQFADEGIYAASVVVTDNIGVIVESGERIVDCRTISLDADTLAGQRELTVNFQVDAQVGSASPTQITIDFGDGSAVDILRTFTDNDPAFIAQVPHTFLFIGTYQVDVTVETIFRGASYVISADVTVVVGFGTPVIESLNPLEGIAGEIITITGLYFEDGSNGVVRWNGTDVPALSWSDTQITFAAPDSSVDGEITVVNEGLESAPAQFKVKPNPPDWGGGGVGQI